MALPGESSLSSSLSAIAPDTGVKEEVMWAKGEDIWPSEGATASGITS